jgi:hypothetical protein
MLRVWVFVFLGFVAAACGGSDRLSMEEFAAQSEDLIAELNTTIDTLDADWTSQEPTAARARAYWDGRLGARTDFLEGMRTIHPPREADDLFEVVLDLVSRFTAAEEALAAHVATFETVTEHWAWWDTPEGRAAHALDEEAVAICHAVQGEFDATRQLEALSDLAWMPSDVQEVIEVALGCR